MARRSGLSTIYRAAKPLGAKSGSFGSYSVGRERAGNRNRVYVLVLFLSSSSP